MSMGMTRKGVCISTLVALSFCALSLGQAPQDPSEVRGSEGDYRIGMGDVLQIVVWKEPELNHSLAVRPDGKISVPLVNDIYVEGKTTEEIRIGITDGLDRFIRDPHVTVIVAQINSFPVYLLGEVNNQGVQSFTRPTRLLQALATAGGLTQFSKKEIVLIRDTSGIERRIPLNYKRLVAGEASQENIFLKPGDLILVN